MFLTEGMGSRQGLPWTEGQERWKLISLGTLVPFQGALLSDVVHGYALKWTWLSYCERPLFQTVFSMVLLQLGCWGVLLPTYLTWGRRLWPKPPWLWGFPSGGQSVRAPLQPGTSVLLLAGTREAICEGDGDEGLSGLSPSCHHVGRTSSQKGALTHWWWWVKGH